MSEPYDAALRHKCLTKKQEHALCTRYAKLRDSHGAEHPKTLAVRNQLLLANMRAIAKQAIRFKRLPFEDLMGEGVKGMIVGIERFEPERGWRLSTFAMHWIRQSLQRACENLGKAVRIPAHTQQKMFTGQEGDDGVRLTGQSFSLDAALDVDGGCLYDLLSSQATSAVDELDVFKRNSSLYQVVLETLSPREREIIERRYLSGDDETLAAVGEKVGGRRGYGGRPSKVGISRERVRQLEAESLAKLRKALILAGFSRSATL